MVYNACMQFENAGKDKIFLFALSTCIWCRKVKGLLDELGADYEYVFVDKLEGDERQKAVDALIRLNPAKSFPTLVAGKDCVVGFQEERVKELASKCWKK